MFNKMGGEGFEPSTTWSQTRNHTKLDHPPEGLVEENNDNNNSSFKSLAYFFK